MAGPRKSLHLVLVGTSVLRNSSRLLGGDCGVLAGRCGDPRAPEPETCSRLLGECLGEAVELVAERPGVLSAELNAMDWVLASRCSGVEEVRLLASDTEPGRAAAEILRGALEKLCPGVRTVVETVPGLGRREAGFWPGLIDLVKTVVGHAREAYGRGLLVYLNATGGFKPESAAALLAASAAAPVTAYYKHEAMRETVVLPQLPVTVDAGRLRAAMSLLHAAAEEDEVDPWDPRYEQIAWILWFMYSSHSFRTRDGRIVVDERARETFKVLASIYEYLVRLLS